MLLQHITVVLHYLNATLSQHSIRCPKDVYLCRIVEIYIPKHETIYGQMYLIKYTILNMVNHVAGQLIDHNQAHVHVCTTLFISAYIFVVWKLEMQPYLGSCI